MALQAVRQTIEALQQQQAQLQTIQVKNNDHITALRNKVFEFQGNNTPAVGQSPQLVRNLKQIHQIHQIQQLQGFAQRPSHTPRVNAQSLHNEESNAAVIDLIRYMQPTRASVHALVRTSPSPPHPIQTSTLSKTQVRELVQFVKSSPHGRRFSLAQIPATMGWQCNEVAVRHALGRQGYKQYPAIVRPRIDEQTRQFRLAFALKHVNWSVDQWNSVLWSAETKICVRNPQEVLVTRKSDEESNFDCIVDEAVAPSGQVSIWFRGNLSGSHGKGPLASWDDYDNQKYGPLDPKSYHRKCIPAFRQWLDRHQSTAQFAMQADFPLHAVATASELRARHMPILHLPPASPDLNPVTDMFNAMKAALAADKNTDFFGEAADFQAKAVLLKAWIDISKDYMQELIEGMSQRCQAVIDADGMYTRL